tara:strand:- start:152 stop:316 length:165 start_codon:yes stop_codon:yes gene_type:complete
MEEEYLKVINFDFKWIKKNIVWIVRKSLLSHLILGIQGNIVINVVVKGKKLIRK